MKHKLKLKLVVVLSASMLLNIFLMWELKRKTDYSKKLEERIKRTVNEWAVCSPAARSGNRKPRHQALGDQT